MLLKEKTVIITGANGGIGRELVKKFAYQGANVFALTRQEGSVDDLANELNATCEGKVIPICLDIMDDDTVKKVFMQIYKDMKKIDILVNNAGIMQNGILGMITNKMISDQFEINVFAVINLTQIASRFMMRQKSGNIINIASIVGITGSAGQTVYSATKGAVIAFTKASAKELASHGIRVNGLAPGMIDTRLLETIPQDVIEQRIENIKLGRLGKSSEVAEAAVFLASDKSSYISGQILGVDGCSIF